MLCRRLEEHCEELHIVDGLNLKAEKDIAKFCDLDV